MSISHQIDWLQYSADYPTWYDAKTVPQRDGEGYTKYKVDFLQTAVPLVVGEKPNDRPSFNFLSGYTDHWDFGYCAAFVDFARPEQKIGVRYQGNELEYWRSLGYSDEKLIQFVEKIGATTSRVDIAFDFRGYGIDPLRIYADWERGSFATKARKVFPYTEAIKQPDMSIDKATTLYIGSRSSEFCFRIYEKGKEQKTAEDWQRVEIELKGDRAIAAMYDMAQHGVGAVGVSLIQKTITKCSYRFWKDLQQFGSVPVTPTRRKDTNRELWLVNMVLPVLYQQMIDDLDNGGGTVTTEVEKMMRNYRHEAARRLKVQTTV